MTTPPTPTPPSGETTFRITPESQPVFPCWLWIGPNPNGHQLALGWLHYPEKIETVLTPRATHYSTLPASQRPEEPTLASTAPESRAASIGAVTVSLPDAHNHPTPIGRTGQPGATTEHSAPPTSLAGAVEKAAQKIARSYDLYKDDDPLGAKIVAGHILSELSPFATRLEAVEKLLREASEYIRNTVALMPDAVQRKADLVARCRAHLQTPPTS